MRSLIVSAINLTEQKTRFQRLVSVLWGRLGWQVVGERTFFVSGIIFFATRRTRSPQRAGQRTIQHAGHGTKRRSFLTVQGRGAHPGVQV